MQKIIPIVLVVCGCGTEVAPTGALHDSGPRVNVPNPNRSDAQPDLPRADAGDAGNVVDAGPTSTCRTRVALEIAIEGERSFVGCSTSIQEGILRVQGTQGAETFVVELQLEGRGSTDTFESGTGVVYRVEADDERSTWFAFGDNCDIDVSQNEAVGGPTYRVVGSGRCGRTEPTADSDNSRRLRFRSFSFDAQFDWP